MDFYCPRAWGYAEDCLFICHNMNAAIWHDGTGHETAKTVLRRCTFTGDEGFRLGRFHRDAQFYLIDCKFPKEMADAPIYKVRKDTVLKWETRVRFYGCHRDGGDFGWFGDNILKGEADKLDLLRVFEGRWEPRF